MHNKLLSLVQVLLGIDTVESNETISYGTAETAASNFGRHGFTPYLVTFVAQTLSALDDHAAALRLLITWQNDLQNLVEVARRAPRPMRTDRSAFGSAMDLEDDALLEVLKLSESWYSLSNFIDIILLQQLSENSDLARPPTEDGLGHLVTVLFPAVLVDRLKEDRQFRSWREGFGSGGEQRACRAETHSWRQPLVMSYAGWVKVYLDLRNRNFFRAADVSPNDIELAEMLGSLDLECFRDELRTGWDVNEQRANFVLTETQIRMNELTQDSIDSRRRDNLRLMLERKLNQTIDDLVRHQRDAKRKPLLEGLVFGQGDTSTSLLDSARSLKLRLDAFRR